MLRFGTVGSGWITDEYIRGAVDTGLWKLTAVYSRTQDRGEEYAKKHGAENVFTDILEMAKSSALDAVYIASPNSLHYEYCKVFLEQGKHVICEKPLAAQGEKIKELQALAEKNQVVYLEAIMYMHLPQRQLLMQSLEEIGEIKLVKIDFCQRSSKLDAYLGGQLPNIFNPALETGAFMDLGVYCVYPALALFGLPQSVSGDAVMLDSGADAGGILTLKYPDKLVTLTYSKLGEAKAGSEFQGTQGTVYVQSISRLAGMCRVAKDGTVVPFGEDEEKSRLMGYEAADFYAFITSPGENVRQYASCKQLALQVSEFMESTREKLGIHFPSDQSSRSL